MTDGQTPTEMLREEHTNVLQKLDALDKITNHLDKKEEVSAQLKELASFFKTDFWVHFTKEEVALFPEIERFIPREGGPTGMMWIEHEDLRNTNTMMQQAINTYLSDSATIETEGMIQRHGKHFIGVLRDHIAKENDILFMMADMHLDQAQVDKVLRLFHEIEKGPRQ